MRVGRLALLMIPTAFAASAHMDRVLRLSTDGSLEGLPAEWGPLKLATRYASARKLDELALHGPRFDLRLPDCIVDHVGRVDSVEVTASWDQDPGGLPPYLSLQFYRQEPASELVHMASVKITISLVDGKLLMAHARRDDSSMKSIDPPDSCDAWASF